MFKITMKCYVANIPQSVEVEKIRTKKEARKIARQLQRRHTKHEVYGYGLKYFVRKQDWCENQLCQ